MLLKFYTINYTADFENLLTGSDSIEKLLQTAKIKNDLIRYILGIIKPAYQSQLEDG